MRILNSLSKLHDSLLSLCVLCRQYAIGLGWHYAFKSKREEPLVCIASNLTKLYYCYVKVAHNIIIYFILMRFFALSDVEAVNFRQKKIEIDLIMEHPYDYLRCELHNWCHCLCFYLTNSLAQCLQMTDTVSTKIS